MHFVAYTHQCETHICKPFRVQTPKTRCLLGIFVHCQIANCHFSLFLRVAQREINSTSGHVISSELTPTAILEVSNNIAFMLYCLQVMFEMLGAFQSCFM
jgi:hypothetical protein